MKKCPFHLYDTCSPPREFRPFLARACIASRFNILHFCLVFFNFLSKLSNSVQIVQLCPNCPTLSKLSNYVQIVQLCSNCPILSKLSNYVQIVQFYVQIVQLYPNCPIMFKLSNFMSKVSNSVQIVHFFQNCPILFKLSNSVQIVQFYVQIVEIVQLCPNSPIVCPKCAKSPIYPKCPKFKLLALLYWKFQSCYFLLTLQIQISLLFAMLRGHIVTHCLKK